MNELTEQQLLEITGGINWGTIGGSCAKGALFGAAFGGNVIAGCAVSAGLNLGKQIIFH